ncbi:hypothetical protein [Paenibacillus puerhi]|uniref:hypothetical protein n=1 Tax=Paenibacillus puerhi TaxID=2692622 RepID=UPI00135B51D4|nr:hypothetical protein [Paenibacillus puerhi]
MAFNLENHPYFTEWVDPISGVKSYVLTKKQAPIQQSFYFSNYSISNDEKWLWFFTFYPPATYRSLGVVSLDPDNPFIQCFPEITLIGGPMIAPEGDAVYFCQDSHVWHFRIGDKPRIICSMDKDYINGRTLYRMCSHLTMSADGKYFLLDGEVGNHWFIAIADKEKGTVEILKEFPRRYNHAQFNPTKPELFSMAEDWWYDRITGRRTGFDHRIWLMDTLGTKYEPMKPKDWFDHGTDACHEWWSKDGLMCWVDYNKGVFEHDVDADITTHVWKTPLCHAHCNSTREFYCADESPYKWETTPCRVSFFNRNTGAEIDIVSGLPVPIYGHRSPYHLDPHPQFSPKDTWIVYTTTVMGGADVALTSVADLIK